MSLLKKSEQNIISAKLLKDNNLFASSVHCSYYSCVQRMLNIVHVHMGSDKDDLKNKCKINATGSHVIMANEVKLELFRVSMNDSESQFFSNNIGNLKRNREAADYHQVDIEPMKCQASIEIAYKINKLLDKYFK